MGPPGHWVRAGRSLRVVLHGLTASACLGVRSPVAAQPAIWRLSASPALTIDETGGPQGEFLRISGLARLASGGIAVANGATAEIRLFTGTGGYLRTLGRRGGGPGEFRAISWMGVSGDTILVADRTGARITRYLKGLCPASCRNVFG